MSNEGSFLNMFKAMTGRGQGSSSHTKSVDNDSKFMEEMYSKSEDNISLRKSNAQAMVDSFYNIITDFYEQGWGQSFHFAPRAKHEKFSDSIIRFEHFIALKLGMQPNDNVLDLGCGIGGPMRNIQLLTGSKITGVTINQYQVDRGNEINLQQGFAPDRAKLVQDDFCTLSKFKDNTFDKVFALESTCHAPDRTSVYKQVYRTLKPGGLFVSSEWVLNGEKFDTKDKEHMLRKHEIEHGNALPDLITDRECLRQFEESGFEILDSFDMAQVAAGRGQLPWYSTLEYTNSLDTIQHTYAATVVISYLTKFLETVGVAPKGTNRAYNLLCVARDGLVGGGQKQLFTPMFVVLVRKPLDS